MSNHKLEISDFDFDNIKANLKTFLQNQSEFQDYNFEGSGFAILLDILAYNTHYLGFNANMLANEMFLDSADIRKNIVSLAKMINYTPSSVRAPYAELDVTVNNVTGSTLTMPKGTVFTSIVNGQNFQFVTNESYTINPINGVFLFDNIDVYEGTLVTFKYSVDTNDPDQKFIIPSEFADTTTLKVSVQNSVVDTTTNVYTLAGGYNNVTNTSKVYFLQEVENGRFQVYFGDGILSQKLNNGNIVILEYIVTNVQEANGASTFTINSPIAGFTDITVATVSNAEGGALAETKESIRFNAPLNYTTQNRAVTTSDYETLVRSIYPSATAISAYGGEDEETPVYGVVKIVVKPSSGSTLTNSTKNSIITALKPYNVASVRPEIIDPEITKIILNSTVKFNSRVTSKSAPTIKSEVITTITDYNNDTLSKFDGVFRYSKLLKLIDETDTSILSNITKLEIRKTFTPTLNQSKLYNIYFRNPLYNPVAGFNAINGGILVSSGFKINGDTTNVFFLDDDGTQTIFPDSSVRGNIRRYRLVNGVRTYANNTQGIINYTTGAITLNSLNISVVENIRGAASTVIELTVKPNSNDVVPVRNQILEIDIANSTVVVEPDTFVGGSSDAGVGYTTTTSY